MHAAFSLITQAEDFYRSREYLSALERFIQSKSIYLSIHAEYGISVCYLALKDYSKAIEVSERCIDSQYSDKFKLVLFKAYEGLGELQRSKEVLETLFQSTSCQTLQKYSEMNLIRLQKLLSSSQEYLEIYNTQKTPSEVYYLIDAHWHAKWQQFTLGITEEHPGCINNTQLIEKVINDTRDYASIVLKQGIYEDIDYILIPQIGYELLKQKYGSNADIKRFCVKTSTYIDVEINFIQIKVLALPVVSKKASETFDLFISKKESLQEIISACKIRLEQDFDATEFNNDVYKVWTLPAKSILQETSKKILLPEAKLLKSLPEEYNSGIVYIIEFQKIDGSWSIYTQAEEPCPCCNNSAELVVACKKCNSIYYCSDQCLKFHSGVHGSNCHNLILRLGRTGLQNLGNTCYMNSIIQCLSHNSILTSYFISNDLNLDFSDKRLTQAYMYLINKLWGVNNGVLYPSGFKRVLEEKFRSFEGFGQQDAHELLVSLLNGMHDELKTTTEENYEDEWTKFLYKNRSVIGYNMFGMTLSSITCPKCSFKSESYETFLTFPVQVPNNETLQINLYVVLSDPHKSIERRVINCYYSWGLSNLQVLLESEYRCDIVITSYLFFEYRGYVENTEIGDYKGRVLIAYEKNNDNPVVVTLLEKKNRVTFDRIIFLPQCVRSTELYSMIINLYQRVFALNSIELTSDNISQYFSAKVFNSKTDKMEELTVFDSYLIEITEKTGILIEFNNLKTANLKEFKDLASYQIPRPLDTDLISLLRQSLEPETLDSNNKWHCTGCKSFTTATKQTKLVHFPKVLAFHLLKFKNSLTKIHTFIDFPIHNLEVKPLGCDKTYELFAVCNHYGSYSFGHYTSYVKSYNSEWVEMNDSTVSMIPESSIVTSSAYILFYMHKGSEQPGA